MKRLLLILILLFPIITLVIWVYFGTSRTNKTATTPAVQTNTNAPSPQK